MRVSTIHLRALLEAFEAHGRHPHELLAACQIPAEVLSDGYSWIDLAEFDGLLCSATLLTEDPAFGLHWGERSPMHQFDLLPPLVTSAATLRSGVECLLQFQAILGDRPELAFEEHAGHARFQFEPFAQSTEGRRVRADFMAAAFARLLRYVGADDTQIQHVALAHARPEYGAEYDRLFAGGRVDFSETDCSIRFDARVLDKPLLMQNPVLHRALDRQARSVRNTVLATTSFHERIQELLRSALPETLDMQGVARALGLSERSLRRRLEAEGYTYSSLVEQTKQDVSLELLGDLSRPIKEVAGRLGFADARTFHRAFRRWTHSTPTAYRRQLSRTG